MKPPKHSSYKYLVNLIPSLAIALALGLGVSLHPTTSTVAYAKHSSKSNHHKSNTVKHKYKATKYCIRLVGEIDAGESVAVKLQFSYHNLSWVTKKHGELTQDTKKICYKYHHDEDIQAAVLETALRVVIEPGKDCKTQQKTAGVKRNFRVKRKSKSDDSWVCHVVKTKKTKAAKHI